MNVRALRSHIGIVSQEPVLFDKTIAENIALGHPDATPAEIEAAARAANAYDFIKRLAKGFGTLVGPRGTQVRRVPTRARGVAWAA
jgi:ATP-binding cassette, subfamily B, bacterial